MANRHDPRESLDLPVLEEKEEREEKKRGAPVLSGSASRGGGWLSRLLGLGGRSPIGRRAMEEGLASAWRRGFLPGLAYLLSYRGGIALIPVALGAAFLAFYALGGFNEQREDGAAFVTPESGAAQSSPAQAKEPGSLNYFIAANRRAAEKAGGRKALGGSDAGALAQAPADKPNTQEAPAPPPADPQAAQGADKDAKKYIAANFFPARSLGSGNGLAGGGGLSGGIMRPFEKPKDPVKTGGFRGNVQVRTTSTRTLKPAANLKGSMNQLVFVSGQSLKAKNAAVAETQSSQADQAFEKQSAQGGGNVIGAQGGPMSGQATDVLGQGEGGPIDSTSITPPTQVPTIGNSPRDNTPYNNLVYVAVALLTTASLIILIEGILAALGKILPPLTGIALMLMGIAMAMAASAAAMGAMVANNYGQQEQGLALITGGSITSAAALAAMVSPPEIMPIISVIGGIAGLVAAMLGLLLGHRV